MPGADQCEACLNSLTTVEPDRRGKTGLERSIESDTVSLLSPAKPVTVPPTAPVREVVGLLTDKNIGCVLVVFCDALIGIFSERDVLIRIGDRFEEVANDPIRHFMTPAPETLSPQDSIAFVLNRMAVGGFRHVPIEVDERPIGIVSARDVLAYATQQFPEILAPAN